MASKADITAAIADKKRIVAVLGIAEAEFDAWERNWPFADGMGAIDQGTLQKSVLALAAKYLALEARVAKLEKP